MIINFFTRKSGKNRQSLYVRLSLKNQSTEIKLDFLYEINSGKLDYYKNQVTKELMDLYNDLLLKGNTPDPKTIKDMYLSKNKIRYLLETYWDYFANKLKPKHAKGDLSDATLQKYNCTYNHLKDFLECRQCSDINILSVNKEFIDDFENFLAQFNAHNSTVRHLGRLKYILNYATNIKGYLLKNPFDGLKLSRKKTFPTYLEESELKKIMLKNNMVDRLLKVKDVFVFQCFTGLSFYDMTQLTQDNIQGDVIKILRKKTNELSVIYFYDVAKIIWSNYNGKLPVTSNQKMNAYLKEIADLCGINKKLTTHVARHTFATTINLNNGVPMETVRKLLGHSSIKHTEHYAKLLTDTLVNTCKVNNNENLKKVYNVQQSLLF